MDKLHKLKIIRGNKRKKMQRLTRDLEIIRADIAELDKRIVVEYEIEMELRKKFEGENG
jgi:hypothetical protein